MLIAQVAVSVPLYKIFDYVVSDELAPKIQVAHRVLVPFGSGFKIGIIFKLSHKTNYEIKKLKSISQLLDEKPIFNEFLFKLLIWASNYYHHPIGEVLFTALPTLLRKKTHDKIENTTWKLTQKGQNFDSYALKSIKQRQLLSAMKNDEIIDFNEYSKPTLNALLAKDLIYQTPTDPLKNHSFSPVTKKSKLTLNDEQLHAISHINQKNNAFNVFLLDGVTGSGKTEVYLNIIKEILLKGKQALVLVPEIGLTSQTIKRFADRFNVPIIVHHSNINDKKRLFAFNACKQNQPCIVIGTRSALFSPFENLGIIIIDEEHDSAYKQQEGFRYHARDLAIMRAKTENIPIILGSATPSLETYNNADLKKFIHLKLTKKTGTALPLKQIILDIRGTKLTSGLSLPLIDKIKHHLDNNNQVLLFLNRRGFAPILICHDCGANTQCKRCNKPFTYHKQKEKLICHHCDSTIKIPAQCGICGSTHLITLGVGTEQLEQSLKQLFPDIDISRIDRDTTQKKGALDNYLNAISQENKHILIGTQILVKGHHFPNITLVGIIDIDNALFSSDFRATERFAQQYIQVAGRAGRSDKSGEVILQTHQPTHHLLHLLLEKGYYHFAKLTLNERLITHLPPFSFQILIKAADKNNQHAPQFLNKIYHWIKNNSDNALWLLEPAPSLHAKKAGFYRWQILLQHQNRRYLQKVMSQLLIEIKNWDEANKVRWYIDVDPLET